MSGKQNPPAAGGKATATPPAAGGDKTPPADPAAADSTPPTDPPADTASADAAAAEAAAKGAGKHKKKVLAERKYEDGRLVKVVTDGISVWKEGNE